MLNEMLLIIITSFIISYFVTVLTCKLATKFGFIDIPSRPHPAILHQNPIPRAGGIPLFVSLTISSWWFATHDLILGGIIIGSLINVVIGTIDDRWEQPPFRRLGFQLISAIIVILCGVSFYTTNPFGDGILYFDQIKLPFLFGDTLLIPADLILIFWIMFMMNTTNWTKGVSQLPGIAVIAFLTIAGVAYKYQTGNPYQMQTVILSLINAGAILAFLPFNFPPEKIFPGFGGSTFIGFNLALLSILSGGKIATIFIVFAIPIIDAVLVGTKRILTGHNPLVHDREHLYHFLLDAGLSKRQIIYFYWITAGAFGISAVLLESSGKLITIGLLSIAIASFFVYLYLNKRRKVMIK